LAGIQTSCCEEKERNIEKAVRFAEIAMEKGAHIICFQELFTTHWFPREMNKRYFSLAEKVDGLTIRTMRKLAKEYGVVLICPIFEIEEDSFYNSAIVIDADGEILGSYRKIHVPQIPLWEERYYFSSGNHGFLRPSLHRLVFRSVGTISSQRDQEY
jgi:predicted amidohydrolase